MLQARRKFENALAWIERGMALPGGDRLSEKKRELLKTLGRKGDALHSAWQEFEEDPDERSYATLMRYVPRAESAAWRERAMESAAGADLYTLIPLLLGANETARLAARLRQATNDELERLSHYITGPAAKRLAKAHPDVAASVFRALGMRILNAGKSRFYREALASFREAQRCYDAAGLGVQWDALVAEIRRDHPRKYGFLPSLERICLSNSRSPSARSARKSHSAG